MNTPSSSCGSTPPPVDIDSALERSQAVTPPASSTPPITRLLGAGLCLAMALGGPRPLAGAPPPRESTTLAADRAAASQAADQAALALQAADRAQRAWALKADSRTLLLPQNLRSPLWTPANSAADLYPFFVLTSYFTDRPAHDGRWREVLMTETLLTSRLGPLPDDYSLERSAFAHDAPDLERIVFGASEYVKDGLMPIFDLLGPGTPWFTRMRDIEDAVLERASVPSRFGPLPSDGAEVNGNVLQSVSRLYWATSDTRYLEMGERIARAYFQEVLPDSGGLPVHRWDFSAHAAISDTLSLNDHGNEVIGGLAEIFLTLQSARPAVADELKPAFLRMMDRLLELARNPDGLWVSRLRPRTGEVLDRSTPDTWGYAFTAVYMAHLATGDKRYLEAVRDALAALRDPAYLRWDGADSYADAIEGGLLLVHWEPVPAAFEWLDRIFPSLLAFQQADGTIEGWHGDGNFARTALLYALWKTRGASLHPWRPDLRLGAVERGGRLCLHLSSRDPWQGVLKLDRARDRDFLHLPKSYPRLNEFPVWFAPRPGGIYRISGLGDGLRASGLALQEGLPVRLDGSSPCWLEVEPDSMASGPTSTEAGAPTLSVGAAGLLLEAETFSGPWALQTNYPGYSGKGFRVSNARGHAATTLTRRVAVERAGEHAVWARGLLAGGQDRAFSVEVAGQRLKPTHRGGGADGFSWERCGVVTLARGVVEVVIHDEGDGFECPDAVFIAPGASSTPPAPTPSGDIVEGISTDPEASRGGLTRSNLARLLALHDADDAERQRHPLTPDAWRERRAALAPEFRRRLGLDPWPPSGPLAARIVDTLERDGYRIEKLIFESREGMPVTANLYLPAGEASPAPPWPAVLCPVGHWPRAKAEPVVQARGVGLARLGMAALIYDPVGQGERAIAGNEHSLAYLAALVGESNMSYMVWDSIRALDYLETRPDVDARRLGATGCSGGGLNTLYLSAVEPRLTAAAPVCYVCSFGAILETRITHCPCSHVPALGRLTDMGEVAALFAPRPLLIVGGTEDPLFPEAGVRAAFAQAERLYGLEAASGVGSAGASLFFDTCAHDYSQPMRERVYGFFARALQGKDNDGTAVEPIPEPKGNGAWTPETTGALACFPGGRVPEGSLTYRGAVLRRLLASRGQDSSAVRAAIAALVPAPRTDEWREAALVGVTGGWVVTDEDGLRHRVLRRDPPATGPPHGSLLLLDEPGLTPETPSLMEDLASAVPETIVAIEPPFWNASGDARHLATTDALLLGRPLASLWARTVVGHARREKAAGRRVVLIARGPTAGTAALLATLAGGEAVAGLAAEQGPSAWVDLVSPGTDRPAALLPGAGLAGDIADLLRAAAPRPTLWLGSPLRAPLPLAVSVEPQGGSIREAATRLIQAIE